MNILRNNISFLSIVIIIILISLTNSCKLFHPDDDEDKQTTQRIAFLRDRDPDNELYNDNDLWIMDMDGTNQHQLSLDLNIEEYVLSPDGEQICLKAIPTNFDYFDNYYTDLYIINIDGNSLQKLTASDVYYFLPIFTPDGQYLIFNEEKYFNEFADIFIMDINGNNKTNLTSTDSIQEFIYDINTDGTQLLIKSYKLREQTRQELYFIDLNGVDKKCITCDLDIVLYWHIKITPNGKRIIFTNGYNSMETINIDGNNHEIVIQQPLTFYIAKILISPDGKYILYQEPYNSNIYKIDPDGSNNVLLTTNTNGWLSDISDDSQYIVYVSSPYENENLPGQIYIMNQYGENKIRLTYNGGKSPKFQPIKKS